jgi:hypothetical protein
MLGHPVFRAKIREWLKPDFNSATEKVTKAQ